LSKTLLGVALQVCLQLGFCGHFFSSQLTLGWYFPPPLPQPWPDFECMEEFNLWEKKKSGLALSVVVVPVSLISMAFCQRGFGIERYLKGSESN